MIMDPSSRVFSTSVNGIQLSNQPLPVFPNQNLVGGRLDNGIFVDHNFRDYQYYQPNSSSNNVASVSSVNHEEDSPEDCDFSDAVLRYINQMLMEEDMEDKTYMLQESLDLQAAEKSFYDVLGKKYPPSPDQNFSYIERNEEIQDSYTFRNSHNCINGGSDVNNYLVDSSWIQNPGEYFMPELQTHPLSSISQSSYSSSNSVITSVDGLVDSPSSILQIADWNNESQSIWQFRRGVEEASKFLPNENELFVNFEVNRLLSHQPKGGSSEVAVKVEKNDGEDCSPNGSRGKKNLYREDTDLEEERSSKLAAVYLESPLRSAMFDMVLLCSLGKAHPMTARREAFKNASKKSVQQNGQSKGSNGGKGRGKKQSEKKEVVDLRTLLIHCAQAVAADDRRNANELLKQIRQHSSPFGDGNQRLAQCFADGLEARLAGTGSQIYKGLVSKRTSAADILKAYYLYLACCPFRKISNFTANKTIRNLAENSTRLHIIDFGILYGFQWPTFLQRISMRPGGPPKLRITGIEFPQPGFRPAEGVEETGRRLVEYAKEFKVPFEYHAIAKKWDCVQPEDLKIDRDEFLVVNCLYRGKNLLDETVAVDSARNIFLNLIKKINPDVFIHGIVNGAYNAPFFVTRFREALFHFSAMFDILETIVPCEDRERMLIEKEIFGREALNVIACEGWERVERPETYKQWQVRNLRAGFVQIPLEREIVTGAIQRVRSFYHKDFIIDEDSRWLLQGWKGRIIYALSAWKPA
ncbi:scarecrow-like protein 9 [Pistacia vera]|uniref:scarecrow-like protein 9 n=1 Tax=Pistacia vera TaxID=55513 RepID=UPI001263E119|nr:scarecrow-like protein 9 [Pistacia vera]